MTQPSEMGTSVYRGSQTNLQVFPNSQLQPENNSSQDVNNTSTNAKSFANITRNAVIESFPSRKQAIVLSVVDGLRLVDYASKIGGIVGPKNILFISRISHNRVCIYLSSISLVDRVVQDYQTTEINGQIVTIRRLITPSRRVIMSNVCPSIPHHLLEVYLKDMGFTLVSPVSFLRAGIAGDEFAHVMSFRRQVYTQPDNDLQLPPSIVISHENTDYRIYLSFDELKCFLCHQPGHIASRCPSQSNTPDTQATAIGNDKAISESQEATDSQLSSIRDVAVATSEELEPRQTKRQLSSPGTSTQDNAVIFPLPKPAPKKTKKNKNFK